MTVASFFRKYSVGCILNYVRLIITRKISCIYSEFFLRLAIGFYMLIFQPPVNFCSDENIQTIFGTKLEDFLNYRINYNPKLSKKLYKKYFLARRKRPKVEIVRCWLSRQWRYSGGRSTYYYFGALKIFFYNFFDSLGY
jgi:hypothetical protein